MNDNLYIQEKENNKFQKLQKRIINIYKHKKYTMKKKLA